MIEGQQHVIDRRAIGHGRGLALGLEHQSQVFPRNRRSLNSPMGGMARNATHLARKEALPPAPARKIDRRGQPDIEAGNRDRSE
jgi:hypothetical protein